MSSSHSAARHLRQQTDEHALVDQPNGLNMTPSRSSFAQRLPQEAKNHCLAMIFEFVGTFMFLFFALGGTNAVNTASSSDGILAANPAKLFYICMCFGMSLAVNVWIFYRLSGGLFNPAVTIALMTVGAMGPVRGIVIIISQLLGAITASAVLLVLLPGPLVVGTTLRHDTSLAQGVFIEMFLTALLVLTILLLAVEKHRATFAAPVAIGLALLTAEMMGIPYTGGSVNPARSFGPCVANAYFEKEQWIYWVGPILGGLIAAGFYKLAKFLEYETVNPGQDYPGSMATDEATQISGGQPPKNGPLRSDLETGDGAGHPHGSLQVSN